MCNLLNAEDKVFEKIDLLDTEDKAMELDCRWRDAREYHDFCCDGVLSPNLNTYFKNSEKPRILFLLKEAPLGQFPEGWNCGLNAPEDCHLMKVRRMKLTSSSPGTSRRFWPTIALRTYVINSFWKGEEPSWEYVCNFSKIENADTIHGYPLENIAYVNIKKANGVNGSNDRNLANYCREDQNFLKEQITRLAPQIIVCSGVHSLYQQYLTDGIDGAFGNNSCRFDKSRNCLVFSTYHPAFWRVKHKINYNLIVRSCKDAAEEKYWEKIL